MKTRLLVTTLAIASLTALAQTAFAEEINQDKLNQIPAQGSFEVGATAAITYNPDLMNTPLTDGAGIPGSTHYQNINNSATWEYYRFCANPGDTVEIEVHRTTFDMDPAMQICQGTITDSSGVSRGSCGSAGPFIGWADDNNGIPHGVGGWYTDPKFTFDAPAGPNPNEFTLMVFDYISAGPNPQFEIHVSGTSPCNLPPIAEAGANQSVVQGDEICFDGSASSDPDDDELTYFWELTAWPASSSAEIDNSTSETPCFTTDLPGTYTVSLTVNDGTVDSAPSVAEVDAISYIDSIQLLCPCEGPVGGVEPWDNHLKYVTCVTYSAADLLRHGLITWSESRNVIGAAGISNCGRSWHW